MSQPAPGKYYRQGMSLKALFRKFPNDETAEAWFVKTRWPNGIACHHCGSTNVQTGAKHKSMPFRCREKECAKRFSVRTGTVMQSSKLGHQTWAIASYLMSTNPKGISSMKLHREVDITQKSAWHLAHRLRAMLAVSDAAPMAGPVEADEAVKHSVGEYVSAARLTRTVWRSFWAMLKRGYVGVYHHMSPEHLDRYVGEFEGRHNARSSNTIDQMAGMVRGAEGKRLRYADLIA